MKITRYIVTPILLLLLYPAFSSAQYLDNPSFEGPPGISISPPTWIPFDPVSTPDTEPLDCDNYSASDGDTYLTLVAHGSSSTRPNIMENCQSTLSNPLIKGRCYTLSMDLASRDDLGHYEWGEGFIFYRAITKLRIYGSNSISEKGELIVETTPVTNITWETLSLTVRPENDISFLILEVVFEESGAENGNILIDNLILSDFPIESTVVMNETFTLNDLPLDLEASESPTYSWSPSSGLSCYDCRSPQVNSNTSRTYTCTIISSSTGCAANELFIMTFEEEPIVPGDFKIPNVFTPNGDGINDYFEIQGLPPYSALLIYDRRGKELFTMDNYDNSWDGSDVDGNLLPEDTYWYVLITPGLDGKQKGQVFLKLK